MGNRSVTAAAVVAAVSSDAPEVSYAKQVVTCVGTDRLAVAALFSALFLCFDELATDYLTVQPFK